MAIQLVDLFSTGVSEKASPKKKKKKDDMWTKTRIQRKTVVIPREGKWLEGRRRGKLTAYFILFCIIKTCSKYMYYLFKKINKTNRNLKGKQKFIRQKDRGRMFQAEGTAVQRPPRGMFKEKKGCQCGWSKVRRAQSTPETRAVSGNTPPRPFQGFAFQAKQP